MVYENNVDKTIDSLQTYFKTDAEIIKFIFDNLENERSLFWIRVARSYANRLDVYLNLEV